MAQRYQGGILGVGFNPLQAPNAPTIGAATAGNQTVSVAFTAPANVGGSAISTYAVRVSPGNFSATGSASPISVSGLTNGTAYTFSVAALNSYGPSPYSGTVTGTPVAPAIEDYFNTWLYTGTGSNLTVTNGLNLSGRGGLVWIKARSIAYASNLVDTVRGTGKTLVSDGINAEIVNSTVGVTAFSSTGFTTATNGGTTGSGETFAAWTFLEQPNFFDIVTYTGTGSARTVAHNLGSAPGCIMVKRLDVDSNWWVYHRSLGPNYVMYLNLTTQSVFDTTWNLTNPTSSVFSVNGDTNVNGATYVAYLYAHDTSSGGLIQCGGYTGTGAAGNEVTLGWEPQWLLIKRTDNTASWFVMDSMRGFTASGNDAVLFPNLNNGETVTGSFPLPTSTGFQQSSGAATINAPGGTYIYIAIRRGPMKTPTLGTSVYESVAYSGNAASQRVIGSTILTDMIWLSDRTANSPAWSTTYAHYAFDRLRGDTVSLATSKNAAEIGGWAPYIDFDMNIGWDTGATVDQAYLNGSGTNYLSRSFKRAPGFFDEVCYNGTGTNGQTYNHNLGVVPELVIFKRRNSTGEWPVWHTSFGTGQSFFYLNSAQAVGDQGIALMSALPSATQITLTGPASWWNFSGSTYVAYLFASCPGVSKVGSYTGNGTSQTINCGFSSTARFILIKRTDTVGDWYTWDAATGLVAGNDPHLSLDNANAEVTTDDSVDADSTGFIVNQLSATNINVNGGTYIFLAIS